jgi:hypothetical protein
MICSFNVYRFRLLIPPNRHLNGSESLKFSVFRQQGLVFKSFLGNAEMQALDFMQNRKGEFLFTIFFLLF